jgi:hypothetical protein
MKNNGFAAIYNKLVYFVFGFFAKSGIWFGYYNGIQAFQAGGFVDVYPIYFMVFLQAVDQVGYLLFTSSPWPSRKPILLFSPL